MNRLAVTIWRGRVSPVFESAGRLLAVDFDDSDEIARKEFDLPVVIPGGGGRGRGFGRRGIIFRKVEKLREIGAQSLICGAVSDNVIGLLSSGGIRVVGWISGEIDDVVSAFLRGNIYDSSFLMPGCCPGRGGQRRQRRGGAGGGVKGWQGPGRDWK
ncbi:MAG: hypothetical protein GF417_01895 [Candidatus Latescibacteria bacterium]|nr:hypothetical protein [Candidatus Latescibacterota bacterium]